MRSSTRLASASVLAGALLASAAARAEPPAPPPPALRVDWPIDGTITGVAAVAWLGTEAAKGSIAPSSCHWCDRNADGSDALNGVDAAFRRALVWGDTGTANTVSNVLGFAVVPIATLGLDVLAASHDGRLGGVTADALVIVEATALAGAANQLVKFTVARERPFLHALSPEDRARVRLPDDDLSFYSAHTGIASALAVAAGTVASLRRYRLAPLVWAVGSALAVTTGYLRIAADKHYFSDVLVGGLAGSAFGFAVPYLFHRPLSPNVRVAPVAIPSGAGLGVWGAF